LYKTLNSHKVNDKNRREHSQAMPLPGGGKIGWQIADGNPDDIRVCAAHPWGCSSLVFADGFACGTAACPVPASIGEYAAVFVIHS
jgi:hypothetical protein